MVKKLPLKNAKELRWLEVLQILRYPLWSTLPSILHLRCLLSSMLLISMEYSTKWKCSKTSLHLIWTNRVNKFLFLGLLEILLVVLCNPWWVKMKCKIWYRLIRFQHNWSLEIRKGTLGDHLLRIRTIHLVLLHPSQLGKLKL